MFRIIISFAAGFIAAGLVTESGSVKKFKEVAVNKATRLKSAAQKAATAAKEEFRRKESEEVTKEA